MIIFYCYDDDLLLLLFHIPRWMVSSMCFIPFSVILKRIHCPSFTVSLSKCLSVSLMTFNPYTRVGALSTWVPLAPVVWQLRMISLNTHTNTVKAELSCCWHQGSAAQTNSPSVNQVTTSTKLKETRIFCFFKHLIFFFLSLFLSHSVSPSVFFSFLFPFSLSHSHYFVFLKVLKPNQQMKLLHDASVINIAFDLWW